ncbi:hypothetical protein QYF61_008321 [Mycteria americana]|uniref:Uncharacterized protein n=1 Tax=Mycteria americana TaxID=33587 RepID=A0AAN7NDL9_MYCAM|nr:hypothetical protein QYF61_008321 [Mycteria americana]
MITSLLLLATLLLIQARMPLAFLATWAHCWLIFRWLSTSTPRSFSTRQLSSHFPKPVALLGVAVTQVQDLALGLVETHTIDLGPSIQPVQVPLQSLPTLQQINTPAQLGVICKLAEGALDPFVQIIDKDIKQDWPQHRALGNTACDRPPTGVNSIHHHSLGPAIQPVLYPAKSTPVQAMSSQFLQENAVGNVLEYCDEVPLSLLFSRKGRPNTFNLSSSGRFSSPLIIFMLFLLVHSSSLSRSLCKMALPSDMSTSLPSLVSSVNLVRVLSIPSYRSVIKVLNSMGHSIDPWRIQFMTDCQPE